MSVRNLDALLRPRAVAVVGASPRAGSVGAVVMRNLLRGGFPGPVLPVHPEATSVAGVLAWRRVADLPVTPDLGVICTPPETVPELADQLAEAGARAAVVLTAGLGPALERGLRRVVRRRGLRVLGPNCVGVLVPAAGLNASFSHADALPGRIALVAQSGALCTSALDWARSRGIGFSKVISLGNSLDVDVGDCLDHLAGDPDTASILLYLESVGDAREMLSAGRAASRNKPVVVVKAGREPAGARAAASHTGALAGADAVFDAAFRRAGMLRVDRMEELFDAVETLARSRPLVGERVVVVGNGGGPGVMAVDALVAAGGRLAELSPETRTRLDAVLPATWSRANPVDLIGDAPGGRYRAALDVLLSAPEVDALVVLHAPTAIAEGVDAARATAGAAAEGARRLPLLASWLGGAHAEPARRLLREAGIPSYETPERAAEAFLHLVGWRRSQGALTEIPDSRPGTPTDPKGAHAILAGALARGAEWLSEPEARALLDAYGVPHVASQVVEDAEAAAKAAEALGRPAVLKILSPDVIHKSDVGGVVLGLDTPEAVRDEARAMEARVRTHLPDARIEGFTVQPMVDRRRGIEVLVGASTDPIFGPVVLFGRGGTAAEVIGDRSLELPPLNRALARATIERTRVWRRLRGYRDQPAADLEALDDLLVAVARLVAEQPEVRELDLNPVVADAEGALALDARVRIGPAEGPAHARLAILPYPGELEEEVELEGGLRVRMRPIRPEDEPAHLAFFRRLDPDDVRFRFFGLVREMPHSQLARYTQIDYDREMAFVAEGTGPEGAPETLGVVRAIEDADRDEAEFAIVVRSDMKGRGLGSALLRKMIRYCRERGVGELVGQVLPDNRAMLDLVAHLGFRTGRSGDGAVEVRLPLRRRGRPRA
jgi:acetyltransferase